MFLKAKFYNRNHRFFVYISLLIIFMFLFTSLSYASLDHHYFKTHAKSVPFYSFTDEIVYHALSNNGEKLIICSKGHINEQLAFFVAKSNGTGLTHIFSTGYYNFGNEEIYFMPLNIPPAISGNGELVVLAVRAVLDINRRNDFIMTYNTRSHRRNFFQLRLLIPGTNYAVFPELGFDDPIFSMDYNGTIMVSQIEIGIESPACSAYDTAILLSNTDGSNQRILVGPEDFLRSSCSFRWKDYPKSPHQPQLTRDGSRVVFYGQVFGARDPYDKVGEIFVINSNKTNLRQLTFSRRDEIKPEALGSFCLNYFGSRIFYKRYYQQQYYISSISIDGGIPQNHVHVKESSNFLISGDGRRIFYIDENLNNSLVYFDISKEMIVLTLDKSWSGKPGRFGLLENISNESLASSTITGFLGNQLVLKTHFGINHWIVSLSIDPDILVPQQIHLIFQMNAPVYIINDRRISLPSPAYIKNHRAMIPLSIVSKHFGFKMEIFSAQGQAILRFNGNFLQITQGSQNAFFNGQTIPIDPPVEVKGREFFIPASFFRDYAQLTLIWNNTEQTIEIIRKKIS